MNHDFIDKELIFKVLRLTDTKGNFSPALECIEEHDIDPLWVASILYLFIDRYISVVDESKQTEFLKTVLKTFHYMIRDQKGAAYISTFE